MFTTYKIIESIRNIIAIKVIIKGRMKYILKIVVANMSTPNDIILIRL